MWWLSFPEGVVIIEPHRSPMLGCPPRSVRSVVRIPANADSDSDRLRTVIPIDRGQRSGDRGQRLPSTASRAHSAVSVSSLSR
jgi:hypothetical protein